jgi:hypothetical protein
MNESPLKQLLGEPGPDPGCEAAFEELDLYCDAVTLGKPVAERFAAFLRHLGNCDACREDTEGLLASLNPKTVTSP